MHVCSKISQDKQKKHHIFFAKNGPVPPRCSHQKVAIQTPPPYVQWKNRAPEPQRPAVDSAPSTKQWEPLLRAPALKECAWGRSIHITLGYSKRRFRIKNQGSDTVSTLHVFSCYFISNLWVLACAPIGNYPQKQYENKLLLPEDLDSFGFTLQ